MLIPAKALNYGGARSRIQVQLPNGKILPAIAATPINSPRVAIGFDQNGQAWVWGETSKIDIQSTSIRKNRSLDQKLIYPFKSIGQWHIPQLYIAQAGDRPFQQVQAQKILAFGSRGKNKNDFILLTQIGTDQYRLKNREGEKNLNFSSPEFLEAFKTNSRFYGDDYYGILLLEEQDYDFSSVIINGDIRYTPDGGYYRQYTDTGYLTNHLLRRERQKLLSGTLDSISKSSAFLITEGNYYSDDLLYSSYYGGFRVGGYANYSESYSNSILIKINNSSSINYTTNHTVSSNRVSSREPPSTPPELHNVCLQLNGSNVTPPSDMPCRTDANSSSAASDVITNKVTNVHKGADELCLYSKIDNIVNISSGFRQVMHQASANTNWHGQPHFVSTDGEVEDNKNTAVENTYLADGENTLILDKDYFYIKVDDIKNKINLLQTTPFSFSIVGSDMGEIKRQPILLNYPVKYTTQDTVQVFNYNDGYSIFSTSATPTQIHSSEYYINPLTDYPVELIIFEDNNIYNLKGTAQVSYQNIQKTLTLNNLSYKHLDYGYGFGPHSQLNYLQVNLSSVLVTIQSSQLIKYHALKNTSSDTEGHLYTSNNCLGLFQRLIPTLIATHRASLYKRKNGEIIMAFSDDIIHQKREKYADLYRLQGNKFVREGAKKGAYYPAINPNNSDNAAIRFIGYYD
ncbi:MAG: hypothetical protein IM550_20245 [Microcystis sp. M54BS1]|uniref:hypothetical protein n=1 Tax=unclassified Microcystis TaxID=2643300 RepID=UPI002580C442|nr:MULTISPECIES: hypothetical protein [unclassified Microcystis]MCA2541458.1 hypothetical protein [Microcystis sp. M54BS1]MCA2594906.1 hypothetical protein [Microcystis sp. M38BS1]MCA2611867.1 hypothetical protein [Microcystis sp. M27BS1]MCA2505403.1 hypothetical protein [Microcystis sp. M62BS1]MCA2509190.1 hypothetical protein [Microcystis sp. M60BS1]